MKVAAHAVAAVHDELERCAHTEVTDIPHDSGEQSVVGLVTGEVVGAGAKHVVRLRSPAMSSRGSGADFQA